MAYAGSCGSLATRISGGACGSIPGTMLMLPPVPESQIHTLSFKHVCGIVSKVAISQSRPGGSTTVATQLSLVLDNAVGCPLFAALHATLMAHRQSSYHIQFPLDQQKSGLDSVPTQHMVTTSNKPVHELHTTIAAQRG